MCVCVCIHSFIHWNWAGILIFIRTRAKQMFALSFPVQTLSCSTRPHMGMKTPRPPHPNVYCPNVYSFPSRSHSSGL